MSKILIVDDELNILTSLARGLKLEGYYALTASNGKDALEIIAKEDVGLVLLDIVMPKMDGIETLMKIKELNPELTVIMMSAQEEIEVAVKSMELGAKKYLVKPAKLDEIIETINPFLSKENTFVSVAKSGQSGRSPYRQRKHGDVVDAIIGKSPEIQQVRTQIQLVASSDERVLIFGENGTGKELVARAIHRNSHRKSQPLIEVNCAAIPEELVESELFGHERGAFTGATERRIGKFEQADKGTLFLDEIGDMSLRTQAKVLRVLETGRFERVGGNRTIKVDVRVIAASNKNLQEGMAHGNFREDLFYRLNVIPIYVPPLRERKNDISLLVKYFANEFQKDSIIPTKTIDRSAIDVMQEYSWPGNVRELKNVVVRLLVMTTRDLIVAEDVARILGLTQTISSNRADDEKSLKAMVEKAEAKFIMDALQANDWNVSQTARKLKIERSNLYKKFRKYGIVKR